MVSGLDRVIDTAVGKLQPDSRRLAGAKVNTACSRRGISVNDSIPQNCVTSNADSLFVRS